MKIEKYGRETVYLPLCRQDGVDTVRTLSLAVVAVPSGGACNVAPAVEIWLGRGYGGTGERVRLTPVEAADVASAVLEAAREATDGNRPAGSGQNDAVESRLGPLLSPVLGEQWKEKLRIAHQLILSMSREEPKL
jgi:hypothetical protein